MNRKKFYLIILTIVSMLTIIPIFSPSAEGGIDGIGQSFSFTEPETTEINISNITYHKITLKGLPTIDQVGEPILPVKPLRLLLPQKGMVESINISYGSNISLGNGFNVLLGKEPINNFTGQSNVSNESHFDPSIPYPTTLFSPIGIQNFRGYLILVLNLYPVHYIHDTGEVYYYDNMTVTIRTNETGSVSPLFRGLERDELMMKQKVDNYCMSNTYDTYPDISHASIVDPSKSYEYVIITTENLKNASSPPLGVREWYTFQDLADYKNTHNTNTTIVTIEKIKNEPFYWNTTNTTFNDTQAQIRNFIIDAYQNWHIEYVLLGGDHKDTLNIFDIVPARGLWYKEYWVLNLPLPSDLYYACLDGNYNYDGNDKWGEPSDGEGGGDVDLLAEVYVGRACAGNPGEVSNFVIKTITYENTPLHHPYLKRALMVGQYLEKAWPDQGYPNITWGGDSKDVIINGSDEYNTTGIPGDVYNIKTLYDRDWEINDWPEPFRGGGGWQKSILKNKINNDIHIINNAGHGFTNRAMKMQALDTLFFTNKKYCFVYSKACFAGAFDNFFLNYGIFPITHYYGSDCFAEYLTVKTKHGAFAAIMNAREGYSYIMSTDGPSDKFDREFFDAVYGENITELGKANQDSKEDNLYCINSGGIRQVYYQLNLFGDPQLSLKLPVENHPPNTPRQPWGNASPIVKKLWTYHTNTTDPDGDQIQYKWKWDGVEGLFWWGPYNSNETANMIFLWLLSGEHTVSVKARDIYGAESNWSDPLTIIVNFNCDIVTESYSVVMNKMVNLYGKTEDNGISWRWDFGEGQESQYQQNATQTYDTLGNHTLTLTVTNDQNISSNVSIVVTVVPMKAGFIHSTCHSIPNETIYFSDTSDGYHPIINWSWDFGDGNISYGKNASHQYMVEDVYTVSLTVTDSESNTDVSSQTIFIDSSTPEMLSVSSNLNLVGYGYEVIISVNISDSISGVKKVTVNVTYPDDTFGNFTMSNINGTLYEYVFNDTWNLGEYGYTIWVVDNADNSNISSRYNFTVSRCFGYNRIGISTQSIRDTITGSRFLVHENGISVDNITVYLDPGNATSDSHYMCMIYRHNDSKLIGESEEMNISDGKGWRTFSFSVPKPVLMNDTEYVIACWADNQSVKIYYDNGMGDVYFYDDGTSSLQGHYFEGIYNYTPDVIYFDHENRRYSIYCRYSPDTTPAEITNVTAVPDVVGFGFNITITADVTDAASGVNIVNVKITYPDLSYRNFTMSPTTGNAYHYVFADTWQAGVYNYSIWVVDYANNMNYTSGFNFTVSGEANMMITTTKNNYTGNDYINLTDPPGDPAPSLGYELLDDGRVLHLWNQYDSYYFNTSSGIQLTNHYGEYWSQNVLMLGYYNNNQWNLLYRTDELTEFSRIIETDNVSFVNVTLWKDLSYGGYQFRLGLRYHLGVNDNDLTVIPSIKNIGATSIPYVLGFGWELKDIQINMTTQDDYLLIDQDMYLLNQTLDKSFTNLNDSVLYLMENMTSSQTRSLYLRWSPGLNYKLLVKSRAGQVNAPVTLFIRVGTLAAGQQKHTLLHWYDASQETFYFNAYDENEAWEKDPELMTDESEETFASTDADMDIELCNENTCEGEDHGTILKVEVRAHGYYNKEQENITLVPVFGENRGKSYTFVASDEPEWSEWFDITDDDSRSPGPWNWSEVDALDCLVTSNASIYTTLFCSMVELRITYSNAPSVSNPSPPYGADGIPLQPWVNIVVSDPDEDSMNVTWYSNSTPSLLTLRPNANGSTTELERYPTSQNANYQCVDETAVNDSDYVKWKGTSWKKDTYNLPDHTNQSGTIRKVTVYARCAREGSIAEQKTNSSAKIVIRSGGTDYYGSEFNPLYSSGLLVTYTNYTHTWTTNPATGNAWTWSDIDTLQAGIAFIGNEGTSECTHLYVVVNYTNPSTWLQFGVNSSIGNGVCRQRFLNATVNGQWWYWKVKVDDGTLSTWSSVYKFYTGYQSKIENTGQTNISGYLLMQVQYYNESLGSWTVDNDTVNETTPRIIYSSSQLGLDTIFNGKVRASDLTHASGLYRVYAAFRDPEGNTLKTDDETELEAWWQFTKT